MSWFSDIFDGVKDFLSDGVGSVVSAGASLLGGSQANSANTANVNATNATSIELANTAHQREVKDLIAAGLNPMLSSKFGGSPMPNLQTPQVRDVATPAAQTGIAANSASVANQQLQLNKAQSAATIGLTTAQTAKTAAETKATLAGIPEKQMYGDIYGAIGKYVKPTAAAVGNSAKSVGSIFDRMVDGAKKLYPPDPKTGKYHF